MPIHITITFSLFGLMFLMLFIGWLQNEFFSTVTYKLKKGKHYARPFLPFFCGWNITRLTTNVKFSNECLYNEEELPYSGINKLTGITFGMVHSDSYRWGWRSLKDTIQLYAYIYDKGEVIKVPIFKVVPDIDYELMIIIWLDKVQYFVNDKLVYENTVIDLTGDIVFTYINRPYFGGKSVSPHDMAIEIKHNYN